MDNETDSSITFDQNGYCNYCTDVIRRMPDVYFPGGGLKLKSLFREIRRKCRNDTYDCLVGLSGGIDSSFLLYLGYRAGLRMLGVHSDDAVMIGDRMDTDIIAGIETGLDTVLVLSGVSTRETCQEYPYRPKFILDGVGELPKN